MKISVLQMNLTQGEFNTNLDKLRQMMAQAAESRPDVILLPELWDISYYPSPVADYADPGGERASRVLAEFADKYQVNIVGGSVAVLENNQVYNRCMVFDRNGHLTASYDKTHLFSPAGEDQDFAPGNKLVTFYLDGVRCGVLICYDIRFPEAALKLSREDASVIFIPAAWPADRIMHWDTLLRARAIENQIFIAAANSVGELPDGFHFGGHSKVIDPWGESLAQAGSEEEVITANMKLAIRSQIQEAIPISTDRRPELYY